MSNILYTNGHEGPLHLVVYTDGSWLLKLSEKQVTYNLRDVVGTTLQGPRTADLRELRDLINEAIDAELVEAAEEEPKHSSPPFAYYVHDVVQDPSLNIIVGGFLREAEAKAFIEGRKARGDRRRYGIVEYAEDAKK